MTRYTTSTFLRHYDRVAAALAAVLDGLRGKPFSWGDGAATAAKRHLADLHITLVTSSWLDKRGYVLNRGAKPVGTIYFPAPISSSCAVYALECQAWLKDDGKLATVEASERARRAARDIGTNERTPTES
jgi:hypothetical protein